MIVYEQWHTAADLRVCKRCRELHGRLFIAGTGTQPPLHENCRCYRTLHHVVLDTTDLPPGAATGAAAAEAAAGRPLRAPEPLPTPDWEKPWYQRPAFQIETSELDPRKADPVAWLLWLIAAAQLIDTIKLWNDLLDPVIQRNQPHSQPPRAGD